MSINQGKNGTIGNGKRESKEGSENGNRLQETRTGTVIALPSQPPPRGVPFNINSMPLDGADSN